jgi:hypothetical protein
MSTRGSTVEDISEIAAWQKRTAEEVANASNRLQRARADLVATQFGMKLAQELDVVIYEKLGPGATRPRLENIVTTGQCSTAEAKGLLEEIDAFNSHLIQVHDELRPKPKPARAPKKGGRRPATVRS